jgi:hypothetical protein
MVKNGRKDERQRPFQRRSVWFDDYALTTTLMNPGSSADVISTIGLQQDRRVPCARPSPSPNLDRQRLPLSYCGISFVQQMLI